MLKFLCKYGYPVRGEIKVWYNYMDENTFFGRKNDSTTQRCINHLVGLGFKVDTILSETRDEKLPEDLGSVKYDYIICYRSYFMLKSVVNPQNVVSIFILDHLNILVLEV